MNEQLKISLKSVNIKTNKKSTPFELLYSDCEFQAKTSKQQETKLMEFEKEKKRINIKISEPIKEKEEEEEKKDKKGKKKDKASKKKDKKKYKEESEESSENESFK